MEEKETGRRSRPHSEGGWKVKEAERRRRWTIKVAGSEEGWKVNNVGK
jgi:hypothetical protein